MVSTGQGLVRVVIGGRSRCDGRARVGSVVRRAVIASTRSKSGAGGRDGTSHFGVAGDVVLAVAAAKELDAAALGVAVGGRRAVALLLLVDTTEAELDERREEKEDAVER